jgi:uncharacterized protein YukJ
VRPNRYSLAVGRVVDRDVESTSRTPHYHILLDCDGLMVRVAINTRSGTSRRHKADLLYFADNDFRHDLTDRLTDLSDGITGVPTRPDGLALDYQRGGMFDHRQMRRIPDHRPGPHNDLVEELEERVRRGIANPAMRLFAYGTRWGPELNRPDHVFGYEPGNGIHDVHMNQGNDDEHWHDNAIWADGGLLFFDPETARWSVVFLAFQTQSWHTDHQGDPAQVPLPAYLR